MTNPRTLTRFDISLVHRDMLNAAVRIGLVDAVEIGVLIHNHGTNIEAVLDELSEAAYARIHDDPKTRLAWIEIRESVSCLQEPDDGLPDKFGFRADARARAREVVAEHGIRL